MYLLMIRKGISAHTIVKEAARIGIFTKWTEVENPVLVLVSVIQQLFGVVPSISVDAFDACSRKPHDDNLVCHIDQVKLKTEMLVLETSLVPGDNPPHKIRHLDCSTSGSLSGLQ